VQAGLSKQAAFASWKQLYNLTLTVTYLSFMFLCPRMFEAPESYLSKYFLVRVCLATVLFVVQWWSSYSCWHALGAIGWYYGDFFDVGDVSFKVTYNGIYRYSNNPDTITGYAALYGAAVLCGSPSLTMLALFSQLCHFLFLRFVEMPHCQRVYGENRRDDGTLWTSVKRLTDGQQRRELLNRVKAKFVESLIKLPFGIVQDLLAKETMEATRRELSMLQARLQSQMAAGSDDGGVQADLSEILQRMELLGNKLDGATRPSPTATTTAASENASLRKRRASALE